MLAFKRFASSLGPKAKLDEFFAYHTTNAALKPWIYRPKNANILLTMDLKDPNTNAPLQPRDPVLPLSHKVLNEYIASLEPRSTDLVEWLKNWTNISIRKRAVWNYIGSSHIQNMLITTFSTLGSYTQLVNVLYGKRNKFLEARNYDAFDVEHVFNTMTMCNLHRNQLKSFKDPKVAERKLNNCWGIVSLKNNETGLANALVATMAKQQGFESLPILDGLEPAEVKLPSFDVANSSVGKLAAFIFDNKNTYLIARTIAEFQDAESVDPRIKDFISNYQTISQKLGKDDFYDMYTTSMKKLWATDENVKKEENLETADGANKSNDV